MNFLSGLDLGIGLRNWKVLGSHSPVLSWVEKKWTQIHMKKKLVLHVGITSVPHQDRIQLLELAADHTTRIGAVMNIHSPLVYTAQSLTPCIAPGSLSAGTEMLSQQRCSKAPHWLPGDCSTLCASQCLWAAFRECCLQKVAMPPRDYEMQYGLRESRSQSKRGCLMQKRDVKQHAKSNALVTVVRLQEERSQDQRGGRE